ncbi:hypothetical protein ACP275_11G082800 [Erythranthe tilingii]
MYWGEGYVRFISLKILTQVRVSLCYQEIVSFNFSLSPAPRPIAEPGDLEKPHCNRRRRGRLRSKREVVALDDSDQTYSGDAPLIASWYIFPYKKNCHQYSVWFNGDVMTSYLQIGLLLQR